MERPHRSRSRWKACALMALLLFWSAAANADGVIEINQVRALAGSVTSSDTAGFPVTLDEPGSYRLTGNLVVSSTDTSAIVVTQGGTTIDLNGFSIEGPYECSGVGGGISCSPTTTSTTHAGVFVSSVPADDRPVTIRNGFVTGLPNGVILQAENGLIEDVTAVGNAGDGIVVSGWGGRCVRCMAIRNGDEGVSGAVQGLVVDAISGENGGAGLRGASVIDSTTFENGGVGMFGSGVVRHNAVYRNDSLGIQSGRVISENALYQNGSTAISASPGALVQGNAARFNSFGLSAGLSSEVGYKENAFTSNPGGTVSAAAVEIGTNVCNGNTTCP